MNNQRSSLDLIRRPLRSFLVPSDPHRAARQFVDSIEQKLAVSQRKDIYIYVHGYKVAFDNPLLVATELWHFLGYDGVMIAFSWPSTPGTLAYMADLETAALSAFNLRLLLEVLASETPAHRIHIIGYSAGTRLVLDALAQMAFIHTNEDPARIRRQCRMGKVILMGSDIFATLLCDPSPDQRGLVRNPETAIWSFPPDYIARLKQGLARAVTGRTR